MSEHKYNDAYSKGFEAGKKQAFTGYCMQCYDDLSPYEQAKLMGEWGADIPNVLDKIRAEIKEVQTYKMFEGEDTVYVERKDVLAIIDRYTKDGE